MHEVAVIVGSIRKDSYNGKLALALETLARGKLVLRMIRIDDLPLLNQDEADTPGAEVLRFKGEVESCAAVLFVTPEHNRSVPAAMKNAFDWGTRPLGRDSWKGKPAAIIGTSAGALGTALAQQNLRTMAAGHVAVLLGAPDAFIRYRDGLFDDDGTVTDEKTRALLQTFVDNFAKLIEATARPRE
jgi:chromate reductase, NAD(P)H dehydrogenase (quinone)